MVLMGAALVLGGCGESGGLPFLGGERAAEAEAPPEAGSVRLVERDVEVPEVFQVTASGLWDGRPSLGGVWVAHPEVDDPERVIIRDTGSEKFVIGALFRREREVPGPPLQVSSDAAEALGLLAGQPRELEVTALRREEVSEPPEADAAEDQETEAALPDAAEVSAAPLDPVAAAEEALAAEDGTAAGDDQAAGDDADDTPSEAAEPAAAPRSAPERPYVQIGIFSVEQNARNTATAMRQAGMVPTVRKQQTQGKTFWRVLVGPAPNRRDLEALLDTAREQGFADAYAVRD